MDPYTALRPNTSYPPGEPTAALVPGRAIEVPELAANGREIAAGSGLLLLLAPKAPHNSGPLDDSLVSRGEGLMGVTIEVADIARVRDYPVGWD